MGKDGAVDYGHEGGRVRGGGGWSGGDLFEDFGVGVEEGGDRDFEELAPFGRGEA